MKQLLMITDAPSSTEEPEPSVVDKFLDLLVASAPMSAEYTQISSNLVRSQLESALTPKRVLSAKITHSVVSSEPTYAQIAHDPPVPAAKPSLILKFSVKPTGGSHSRESSTSTNSTVLSSIFSEETEAAKELRLQKAAIRVRLLAHTMVDTINSNQEFVDEVVKLAVPSSDPKFLQFVLDAEGSDGHGRNHNLNYLQVSHVKTGKTWLLDAKVLGKKLVDTPSATGRTFKQILEDKAILMTFFDVRQDSDSIFAHLGVHLNGIVDVQCMELATRASDRRPLYGLDKCILNLPDSVMSPLVKEVWLEIKQEGRDFCQANGGYGAMDIRPTPPQIRDYSVNDCYPLALLFNHYLNSGCKDKLLKDEPELMGLVMRVSAYRVSTLR